MTTQEKNFQTKYLNYKKCLQQNFNITVQEKRDALCQKSGSLGCQGLKSFSLFDFANLAKQ